MGETLLENVNIIGSSRLNGGLEPLSGENHRLVGAGTTSNDVLDPESSSKELLSLDQSSLHQLRSHPITSAIVSLSRQLESTHLSVHEVKFRFMLRAEDYGVVGSDDSAVHMLAADLGDFLQHSMRSGLFRTKLMSRGVGSVASTRLHSLEAVDIKRKERFGMRTVVGVLEGTTGMGATVLVVACVVVVSAVGMVMRALTRSRWHPNNGQLSESSVHGSSTIGSYRSESMASQSQPPVVVHKTLHSSLRPVESLGLEDARFKLL